MTRAGYGNREIQARHARAGHPSTDAQSDRSRAGRVTDWQRLLTVLSDGKPHSHSDLYRLGLMAHSRAADLRRRGYRIDVWREGKVYLYQLVSEETA